MGLFFKKINKGDDEEVNVHMEPFKKRKKGHLKHMGGARLITKPALKCVSIMQAASGEETGLMP